MVKKITLQGIMTLALFFVSSVGLASTINPMNGQPLPTTQQLMNQCENNTDAANCQQIVNQGETKYQDQQASLQNQVNQTPPKTSAIPKQPGPGSNPTEQPNY